jgi:hypothetical protein
MLTHSSLCYITLQLLESLQSFIKRSFDKNSLEFIRFPRESQLSSPKRTWSALVSSWLGSCRGKFMFICSLLSSSSCFISFDEWTCWSLLLMLALYDLCAVLTPCGPLKMLVGLMQERNEPLPGLLYEANLPPPTDYSQPQERRQHQENVAIPSPMSLGVGMGFGSWAMMMGTPGFKPPVDEEHSTGKSDQMSQASSDAGVDLETSGHGLLPAISNSSGNISLTEPPVVRRKPNPPSSSIPSSAPPPHYDGRSESHPPMTVDDDEFDKGMMLRSCCLTYFSSCLRTLNQTWARGLCLLQCLGLSSCDLWFFCLCFLFSRDIGGQYFSHCHTL